MKETAKIDIRTKIREKNLSRTTHFRICLILWIVEMECENIASN